RTGAGVVVRDAERARSGPDRPASASRTPASRRSSVAARNGGQRVAASSTSTIATATASSPVRRPRLSKDAYRRLLASVEGELTRLGLRKNHLELAMADPAVAANFVELRRVTSELADVDQALVAAEEAWLELEDRAP